MNIINLTNEQPQVIKFNAPKLPAWNVKELTGYEPKTTFWDNFSIAEIFGPDAIINTYKRAFNEWRDDVEYIAELSLVLKHKSHALSKKSAILSTTYAILWERLHEWALESFTGDDAEYYFQVTD